MDRRLRWGGRLSLLFGLLSLACVGDKVSGLKPKLQVASSTPQDSAGHYIVDFGDVAFGSSSTKYVELDNVGTAVLTVQPPQVPAPFATSLTEAQQIHVGGSLQISFSFTPPAPGAQEATVQLTSNGGNATFILRGNGLKPPPGMCTFQVNPMSLAFGNLAVGQSKTNGVRVLNTSASADCSISQVELMAGSDPAFSLAGVPSLPQVVSANSGLPLGVTFAPTKASPSVTGTLLITVGTPGETGTTVQVPLSGSSGSCSLQVSPMLVTFGNVTVGQSKTSAVTITNASEAGECNVSGIGLSALTNPAFHLSGLPPSLPRMLSAGSSIAVNVTFSPTRTGSLFSGELDVTGGQSGASAQTIKVPLAGSGVGNCPNPNPDGSCPTPTSPNPPATAKVYLNDTSTLYSFDPATKAYKTIGTFTPVINFFQMYDIAIDSNGVMVGVSNGTLYYINPNTAACTQLAVSQDSGANGLTFMPDGRLAVAGSEISVFDRSTGRFSTLVPAGKYATSGDIVGLPDGLLYWTVNGSNGTDVLVTVDPTSGATHEIGDTGVSSIWGLSYADNQLYGFTDDGYFVTIDPQTAHAQKSSIGGTWYGAATNPAQWGH